MHDTGFIHGNLEIVSCYAPHPFAHHTLNAAFFQRNVLVDSEGTPRIGGLGSAISEFSSGARSEVPDMLTRSSAPELMDPGAFGLSSARPTKASDVYAFGVLLYQVNHVPIVLPSQSTQTFVAGFCGQSRVPQLERHPSGLLYARGVTSTTARPSRTL